MKRLDDILTHEDYRKWRNYFYEMGETEAVELIDELYEYARDLEAYTGDLVRGADMMVRSNEAVHKMYPNTLACRSRPGLVAGQAMTPHCSATCTNSDHHTDRLNHDSIVVLLKRLIEEFSHTD